jgi:hypothetical protein
MESGITVLHALRAAPAAVEDALTTIFNGEERTRILRLEGTYRSVLARLTDPNLEAAYCYLICRPHADSPWTPVIEVGMRTEGLEAELSRMLGGAAVFSAFVYGEDVSGYRFARGGAVVDQYLSDPTFFADEDPPAAQIERDRGHPERFADLLPAGTTAEDFARVVLRPGWWEEHDADAASDATTAAAEEEGIVDEVDRMRCIALALELWEPAEYPFTADLDTLENRTVGPVIALAYT